MRVGWPLTDAEVSLVSKSFRGTYGKRNKRCLSWSTESDPGAQSCCRSSWTMCCNLKGKESGIIHCPDLAAQYMTHWDAHRQHSQPYIGRGYVSD